MAEVLMSTYVCRWCGALYGLPTAMAENPTIIKRCPSGHENYGGTTMMDRLQESGRHNDKLRAESISLRRQIGSLKGQITKLKRLEALREGS